MRCLCCCQIHAMAMGKTSINSFLFNLAIVMLCTTPLVHFCVISFSGYASYSDAYLLFNVQMGNMAFFSKMFQKHIFTYTILGMAFITTCILYYRPKDTSVYGTGTLGALPTISKEERRESRSLVKKDRGVEMTSKL